MYIWKSIRKKKKKTYRILHPDSVTHIGRSKSMSWQNTKISHDEQKQLKEATGKEKHPNHTHVGNGQDQSLRCLWWEVGFQPRVNHVVIWTCILLLLLLLLTTNWFNKKMSSYKYRKPHWGDKTILQPSYLDNGGSILYWSVRHHLYIESGSRVLSSLILAIIHILHPC